MFDFETFLEDVKAMRAAQKAFFLHRKPQDLQASKRLEQVVDEKIHNYTTGTKQGNLF